MSFTLRRPRVSPGIRKLLLGLLVPEAAYVATGVWLVRSGRVHAWLNKHPERRTVTFESAWSVIPGLAHVSGVRVVNQGRGDQLELVVDRATGFVEPLELVGRRVHVLGLRARGVEFRFRNRPKTPEEAAAGVGTGLVMVEEITDEGVAEMQKGGLVIRHFGVHGGKVDIRFRGLVDSRGAFGKARARVGALKAGIGLEGKERDLTLVRVGTWYRRDDIRGMPALLSQYAGEGDQQPRLRPDGL